ncbi:diguanylate cyclase [Haloimpatiens sp. FM7330]|uniref:sensor domain-containing diguanylate cyclase n=1 Tax=Haloimpatiens sp. FM7330 TaxID=3298610 RepID=UPI0036434CC8
MSVLDKIISLLKFTENRQLFKTSNKENDSIIECDDFKFLQTLIDTIPNPIFFKDEKGIYRHCNTAFVEYLGIKKEDIIGFRVYDIHDEKLADIYYKADNELLRNGGKQIYEAKVKYKNKELRDVLFTKAVFIDNYGKISGIVGNIIDITERKEAEEKVRRLSKIKEAMLEINHAVLRINNINELLDLILQKTFKSINNADLACILTLDKNENLTIASCIGYDSEKAKNFNLKLKESFIWHKTRGQIDKTVIINDIQTILKDMFPKILYNKEEIKVESSISAPIIIKGRLYGLVNMDSRNNYVYDETDIEIMEYIRNQIAMAITNHKLYEKTIYLSRYDKLTNLYNRRYFEELVDKYIDLAAKCEKNFLLVVFDLNRLKFVNDNYGHLAGDKLIKTFANGLEEYIDCSDIVARFGGDEFIGIYSNIELQALIKKLEDLVICFKDNPLEFEGKKIVCSFSYGISRFDEDTTSYNELVRIADERMYEYKQDRK